MRYIKNPRILLLASMTIFGTVGIFVRNISLPSEEIALYRAALALILIGAFLLLTREKIKLTRPRLQITVLLLSGAAMAMNWVLLFEAYKYTTVSNATLAYYFAPTVVTVASTLLFKEKITPLSVLCFIGSSAGIVLITGTQSGGDGDLIGILLGLGAAVLYASVVLMNKLISDVPGIQRTFMQFISAVAVLIPYVLIGTGMHLAELDGGGWISLLIVGIVHTGITYCMYFTSIGKLPGGKVALLSYVDPLVAVLASVFILGEDISGMQIIGGIMILGFSLISEILPKAKE